MVKKLNKGRVSHVYDSAFPDNKQTKTTLLQSEHHKSWNNFKSYFKNNPHWLLVFQVSAEHCSKCKSLIYQQLWRLHMSEIFL